MQILHCVKTEVHCLPVFDILTFINLEIEPGNETHVLKRTAKTRVEAPE